MHCALHWSKSIDEKEPIVKLRDLLILASSVAIAPHVSALSLGNSQGNVQLGSAVDLVFQVQADAGQTAQTSCVAADIWMGDTALGSNQVLLTVQDRAVRVRTTSPVFEPLITVKLSAGCADSMSRSYTFFADPPSALAASVEPIDLSKIAPSTLMAAPRAVAPRAQPARTTRPAKRVVKPSPAKPAVVAAPAAEAVAAPVPDSSATPAQARTTAAEGVASADKPRLQMEPLEGLGSTGTTPAESHADQEQALPTSPAIDPQTQLLLSANTARMEAMEQQLLALQQQLSSNRTEMVGLQTQLLQAQNAGLPIWVHLMLGLLALALATIAWLLQRLKQARVATQPHWAHTALAAEDTAPAQPVHPHAISPISLGEKPPTSTPASVPRDPDSTTPVAVAVAPAAAAQAPSPHRSQAPGARQPATTSPVPYPAFAPRQPSRPAPGGASSDTQLLTAQALFDVQEQAEFYASIGENNHAIEILQSHIAQHEASSPLAYLELLQLLYRLGRMEMFAQVREKVQLHFNVQVPAFQDFAHKGRDLYSSYPEILEQIEALWPSDEVQALLRSLIVRPQLAAPSGSAPRLDLCAFDELLMLYNVAQTTPAANRGPLPARTQTTLPATPQTATPAYDSAPEAADALSLNDAYLDLLNTAPAQAPLAPTTQPSDSPFQGPSHFAPDEALVDGLTLEWDAQVPHDPATTAARSDAPPAPPQNLQMDVLDLPAAEQPRKPK